MQLLFISKAPTILMFISKAPTILLFISRVSNILMFISGVLKSPLPHTLDFAFRVQKNDQMTGIAIRVQKNNAQMTNIPFWVQKYKAQMTDFPFRVRFCFDLKFAIASFVQS